MSVAPGLPVLVSNHRKYSSGAENTVARRYTRGDCDRVRIKGETAR
jgi:hypothetical protein